MGKYKAATGVDRHPQGAAIVHHTIVCPLLAMFALYYTELACRTLHAINRIPLTIEPQLIAKYQRRFPGSDNKIILMYARGMSTREIVGHLRDLCGIDVSPDLISALTDAVLEDVSAWQACAVEAIYPLVSFDALRVKPRRRPGTNKAVHIALAYARLRADDTKESWDFGSRSSTTATNAARC
jgi:hypothetical protein